MKEFIKNAFALTEQGAKDIMKASFASFLVFSINMFPAILLMSMLDELILKNIKNNFFYVIFSLLILIIMYILLSIEYDYLYNTTYKESANLRVGIAEQLNKLPLSYFSKHNLSDLSQTIMSDVEALEHAMSHSIPKLIGFILFVPLISILLILGNLKLGLAVVIPVLLNFYFFYLSKKLQVKHTKIHYEKLRENSESFQEAIEMQQDIKSLNLSKKIKEALYNKMEESEKLQFKANIIQVIPVSIAEFIIHINLAIVIFVGLHLFFKGEINILYLIGYTLAAMKLKEGVSSVVDNIAEIFYLNSRIEKIREIRNEKTQEGIEKEIKKYDIKLKDVSFSYDNLKILDKVSFDINQGEVTAIVGKSGSGKTTILRLISRLYDYDEGEIIIDGQDIKNISTKSLFEKISIVFQDITLFNNSILENIRIGRKNATDEEVIEASKLANCEEFINNLPEKYNTLIGENGAKLSGGERQRISIARAFLKNSPIIILDEIAAALDVQNEKKIQESLNKLIKNKTVLIITHRLKSIENVDKIVVLDSGKIESIGNHKDLLKKSKIYKNLINLNILTENFKY